MVFSWIHQLSRRILDLGQRFIGPKLLLVPTIGGIGLAIAALGLWGFAQLAEEVLEQDTQVFDTSILLTLERLQTPWLDQLMLGITVLGEPTLLVILTLSLSAALLLRQQWAEGSMLAIAALGGAGLNVLLKNVFARARPELWKQIVDVRYYSFPSGHAMVSLVIYGLIGYLLATYLKHLSGWIVSITALLVIMIGFSRLYLGVHWPTDIIAGYAAGLVWLSTCILGLEVWRNRGFYRSSS